MTDDPLNDRLTRRQLAKELTDAGYPVTMTTLRTYGVRGGGPPYAMFRNRAMYVWGEALAWARSRVKPRRGRNAHLA